MTLNNEATIKKDRMRFSKNKLSANLTLLSIVFNALYFVNIYRTDIGSYYYQYMIGISVVYNLLFMLTAFLCSEGVKNYKLAYGYILLALGAGQIVRIFILPLNAKNAFITLNDVQEGVMNNSQFMWLVSMLVASAAVLVIAGVIAIIKSTTLRSYEAELKKEHEVSKS